ncbi:MAG: hypothetical protein K2Q01_09410, partial [Rickettsiales bacterium]|nr:hypothetical protein [Rickettsiales bacterium]
MSVNETPELLLNSDGYKFIREQLQEKILTPHGVSPQSVEKLETAELFALLVQKSGLAFPITTGTKQAGYKYLDVEPGDVSFRFSRSMATRSDTAKMIDAIINPLQARKGGTLEIIDGQGGGSKRRGDMGTKFFQKGSLGDIVDFMAGQLKGEDLDLTHVRPKLPTEAKEQAARL